MFRRIDACDGVCVSMLMFSILVPVIIALILLGTCCTLFATTECLREIRVSVVIAVP
jgi:hypothetical protein